MLPWIDLFLVTFIQALAWVSALTVVWGVVAVLILRACGGGRLRPRRPKAVKS